MKGHLVRGRWQGGRPSGSSEPIGGRGGANSAAARLVSRGRLGMSTLGRVVATEASLNAELTAASLSEWSWSK